MLSAESHGNALRAAVRAKLILLNLPSCGEAFSVSVNLRQVDLVLSTFVCNLRPSSMMIYRQQHYLQGSMQFLRKGRF